MSSGPSNSGGASLDPNLFPDEGRGPAFLVFSVSTRDLYEPVRWVPAFAGEEDGSRPLERERFKMEHTPS